MATKAGKLLEKYDATLLDCRDLRHQWERMGAPFRSGSEVHSILVCGRCGTVRTRVWRAKARKVLNRYSNRPKDYRIPGGVSAYDVRKEVLRRFTVYDSEGAMRQALFTRIGGK